MAPLVPDIIGNELNLIVALLIGIGFGFILEQAGFSTSKKLVGLFYGYDFTVLRVFFTAGITAMNGVIILGHYGLLDLNLIYINPTFIWSAIVGGLIMGLGFVIGGFCPGTSVCAAAIGKIDAMVFVAGSFIGVFIFAEGYPLFEGLYKSGNWGNIRLFDLLGMSQGLFAFLMVFVAVLAFIVTTIIEKKNNGYLSEDLIPVRRYVLLAIVVIVIGISAFAFPERQVQLKKEAENSAMISKTQFEYISVDELAFRLIDEDARLQIFDFRNPEDFKNLSLPNSSNWNLENIFGKDIHKKLSIKNKINVILSDNETDEKKIAYIAGELGYKNIFVLQGGMPAFKSEVLDFQKPLIVKRNDEAKVEFREKAKVQLPILIEANKLKNSSNEKKTKRIIGGC